MLLSKSCKLTLMIGFAQLSLSVHVECARALVKKVDFKATPTPLPWRYDNFLYTPEDVAVTVPSRKIAHETERATCVSPVRVQYTVALLKFVCLGNMYKTRIHSQVRCQLMPRGVKYVTKHVCTHATTSHMICQCQTALWCMVPARLVVPQDNLSVSADCEKS